MVARTRVRQLLGFLLVALHWEYATANPVAFTSGDASFVGVVHADSDFMKGSTIINAATLFCCLQSLDYTKGVLLDVSNLPAAQLAVARQSIADLLRGTETKNKVVLLCVCNWQFDFEHTWIGIPYNRKDFRLATVIESHTNCFGPSGSSVLSTRDSTGVPPLAVEVLNDERQKVVDKCCLCILTIENAILQRDRRIITPDGASRAVQFKYEPMHRICFEEGDAYFISKAAPLLQTNIASVELEYELYGRRQYGFYGRPGGHELVLSDAELSKSSQELPVVPKGRRLLIRDVPKGVSNKLVPKGSLPWFVFVVDANYDPTNHRLGRRYNKSPFSITRRPLNVEYVDCNRCEETFPAAQKKNEWPPSLRVAWEGETAVAKMEDVQFIFFQYWDGLQFYSDDIDRDQFRVRRGQIEHWIGGKLVMKSAL